MNEALAKASGQQSQFADIFHAFKVSEPAFGLAFQKLLDEEPIMKCRSTPGSDPMADELPGNAELSRQACRSAVLGTSPSAELTQELLF